MTSRSTLSCVTVSLLLTPIVMDAHAGDWPQWGRDMTKNMVGNETGLATDFHPGDFLGASDEIDPATARNIKWTAKLGSQSYGNPTVANGRVYVGTNNDSPRDPRFTGDRCVVYCLDEKSGQLYWQLNLPKLGTGKVSDWEFLGMCSSPSVEGDRVYFVTNHCEIVCLDVNGMADGNDGPYKDEAKDLGGTTLDASKPPIEPTSTDADIIWKMNMIDECGVFPHNITSSAVLPVGDQLWVSTSNGVDYGHVETPAPFAPSLVVVDKRTGKLVAEENSGLSQRILHCNWSSPAYLKSDTLDLGIFGGPDGWVYAFHPEPGKDEDGYPVLREAWRVDANPAEYRMKDGKPLKYATRAGPSEVLATPVVYKNRVYALIGQDPEHGEGLGNLVCIDASKGGDGTGEATGNAILWNYQKINRSMSTMSIVDDLVYAADYSGFIYCLDANTGEEYWVYDTKGHIWGSTLVADGKVYVGNEDGYLTIMAAGKEKKLINEIDMMSPIFSSPIVANGVLYVATHTHLFAIEDAE